MGFGIRLPGVRVSTRGIRVGAGFANVRVGRGGVGASVGPRIARVSVSNRGVSASAGLGPVHISTRGAGVRVAGISVSNRGVGASISPGPFWLGGNLSGRRSRTGGARTNRKYTAGLQQGINNSSTTFLRVSPSLSSSFAEYQADLRNAGVTRRNRFEVRSAAAQSIFWELSTIVSFARNYEAVTTPQVPPIPSNEEIQAKSHEQVLAGLQFKGWRKDGSIRPAELSRLAKQVAKSKGQYKLFDKNNAHVIQKEREALKLVVEKDIDVIAADFIKLRTDIKSKKAELDKAIQVALSKFNQLDPLILGVVMQSLLADNPVPATWGGYQNGCGLVFVAFGDSEQVVWPEVYEVGNNGQIKVRNRLKKDTKELHQTILLRTLLAAGKEVLSATPNLSKVRVIAIDNTKATKTTDRDVWGEITLTQQDLRNLKADQSWVPQWNQISSNWEVSGGNIPDEFENSFFTALLNHSLKLEGLNSQLFGHVAGNLKGHVSKSSKEMVPMGRLQDVLPSDGLNWLAEINKIDFVDCLKVLSTTDVNDPEFWFDLHENFL